jgi:hypothetical protein
MNRDEKLTRVPALPPKVVAVAGRTVVFPSEPGGGTWIALHDRGVSFALINWYSVPARAGRNPVSRGVVVNAVSASNTPGEAAAALARLPLHQINPFRLIGVFPQTRAIIEWRWNLNELVCRKQRWRARQFISSGFDEPRAQRLRHRTFLLAQRQKTSGSLDWLRRLHRSHRPHSGPFSTCMHRSDAATVSYTEVVVEPGSGVLRYWAGAPCGGATMYSERLYHQGLPHQRGLSGVGFYGADWPAARSLNHTDISPLPRLAQA